MIPELEYDPCEPAAVLLAQMSGGARWDADTSGPRALMLAILKDAVRCIEQGRWRRNFYARHLAAEAEAWVRSDDRRYPFSFLDITDVLGVDADAVRRHLLPASRTTHPEVRVRGVTKRSPKAVFRHRHPRSAAARSPGVLGNSCPFNPTITVKRSQSCRRSRTRW